MFGNSTQRHTRATAGGFSLIELMVTIAIISIVLAISLAKYGTFNNVVLLKNQAFGLALDIRKAQTYASSVRVESNQDAGNPNGSILRQEVGVYITTAGNGRSRYRLFVDQQAGLTVRYSGTSDFLLQEVVLDDRFEIAQICTGSGASQDCSLTRTDISFARPDFDAAILPTSGSVQIPDVTIVLRSKQNPTFTRSVVVTATGQVSVE